MSYIFGTSCYRPIETHQVIVTNDIPTLCQITEEMSTPDVKVEMYLADESHISDYQLTWDFYMLCKEFGLPDFPFQVSYCIMIMYCRNDSATGDRALSGLSCLVEGVCSSGAVYGKAPKISALANMRGPSTFELYA